MLKHMIEAQVLDGIVAGVDVVVAVLEITLDDECRWISSLGCRSMIRACVSTLSLNVRDLAVL